MEQPLSEQLSLLNHAVTWQEVSQYHIASVKRSYSVSSRGIIIKTCTSFSSLFFFPPKLTATDLVFTYYHLVFIHHLMKTNQPEPKLLLQSLPNPSPDQSSLLPPSPAEDHDMRTTPQTEHPKKEPKPTPQGLHHSSGSSTQQSCVPFTVTPPSIFSWRNLRQVAHLTAPYRYRD